MLHTTWMRDVHEQFSIQWHSFSNMALREKLAACVGLHASMTFSTDPAMLRCASLSSLAHASRSTWTGISSGVSRGAKCWNKQLVACSRDTRQLAKVARASAHRFCSAESAWTPHLSPRLVISTTAPTRSNSHRMRIVVCCVQWRGAHQCAEVIGRYTPISTYTNSTPINILYTFVQITHLHTNIHTAHGNDAGIGLPLLPHFPNSECDTQKKHFLFENAICTLNDNRVRHSLLAPTSTSFYHGQLVSQRGKKR